jgi:K+-transporting ATPase KdpF subunit
MRWKKSCQKESSEKILSGILKMLDVIVTIIGIALIAYLLISIIRPEKF